MTEPAPSPRSQVTREERIALAMQMIDFGFALFPLYPMSKSPMTKNGFKDATRDKDKVRTWLGHAGITGYGMIWPDDAEGDPAILWDVDAMNLTTGLPWKESMRQMVAEYGPLPVTLRTKTPHGYHLFFRVSEAVANLEGKDLLGFVCRKPGAHGRGYVVGPGSEIEENGEYGVYSLAADAEIADMPDPWQKAALAKHGKHLKSVSGPLISISEPEGYSLPTTVAPGGRYDAILAYTASLYNRGDTENEMWALVSNVLAPRFTESYTDRKSVV